MNPKVIDKMEMLLHYGDVALNKGEVSYSVNTDQLDYFPKDWASVYTYINENMLRLDNLYSAEKLDKEKIEDKWIDLFNYVRMGYAVMMIKGVEKNG